MLTMVHRLRIMTQIVRKVRSFCNFKRFKKAAGTIPTYVRKYNYYKVRTVGII